MCEADRAISILRDSGRLKGVKLRRALEVRGGMIERIFTIAELEGRALVFEGESEEFEKKARDTSLDGSQTKKVKGKWIESEAKTLRQKYKIAQYRLELEAMLEEIREITEGN